MADLESALMLSESGRAAQGWLPSGEMKGRITTLHC